MKKKKNVQFMLSTSFLHSISNFIEIWFYFLLLKFCHFIVFTIAFALFIFFNYTHVWCGKRKENNHRAKVFVKKFFLVISLAAIYEFMTTLKLNGCRSQSGSGDRNSTNTLHHDNIRECTEWFAFITIYIYISTYTEHLLHCC